MKNKLELDQETAIKLYKTASPEFKELLEQNFGLKVLSPKVEDRILTFDDVLLELSENHPDLVEQLDLIIRCKFPKHIIAAHKITMIALVFNEGTFMDVLDTNQNKYYPWFEIKSSKLRFYPFDLLL